MMRPIVDELSKMGDRSGAVRTAVHSPHGCMLLQQTHTASVCHIFIYIYGVCHQQMDGAGSGCCVQDAHGFATVNDSRNAAVAAWLLIAWTSTIAGNLIVIGSPSNLIVREKGGGGSLCLLLGALAQPISTKLQITALYAAELVQIAGGGSDSGWCWCVPCDRWR
jgi:hypothetical protein